MKIKNFNILDCSLRDGSYSNNFSFTPSNTRKYLINLNKLGFKMIEIGHGLGLGAYKLKKYKSKYSDNQILSACKNISNKGVFYIPDIGCVKDLENVINYKLKFVRIGTDTKNYEKQYDIIDICKKKKIMPISFLMKAHNCHFKKISQIAHKLYLRGSKIIYIADSAGCMLPEDLKKIYTNVKKVNKKIKLGFHGHNNLGMAQENSLYALRIGFEYIDATLQGIGRSSGNLHLEKLLFILKKKYQFKFNFKHLLFFSNNFIKETKSQVSESVLDILCGYKKIHSSEILKLKKGLNIKKKIEALYNYK